MSKSIMAVALSAYLAVLSMSSAHAEVVLDADVRMVDAAAAMYYLEDPDHSLDFDAARRALATEGTPWLRPSYPTFGYTRSVYWFRVDISNSFTEDTEWLVKLPFAMLDRVDLHYQDRAGQWHQKSSGHKLPFDARDLPHPAPNFTFPVHAGEHQTLYFRAESEGSVQMPLQLMSHYTYQASVQQDMILNGTYFGILLVLVLYCFYMWSSSRDFSYLYFGLYILCSGFYMLIFQGFAFQFLWPDSPDWGAYSLVLVTGLTGMAGLMFVRNFLNVSEMEGYWDRAILGLVLVYLVATYASPFLSLAVSRRMMFGLSGLALVCVTAVMFRSLRGGQRTAWYLAGAWAVVMVSILIEMAQRLGLSMPPAIAYRSMQGGSLLGVAILMGGLSDRVGALMSRYQDAQQEMIRANQIKLDAMQRADSIKEEFIANVSHELRTPLTGIIGLAEIMLENRERSLSDTDKETLQLMKVSAQRLATLVNDVIDFSTLKKGHLELQKRDVDLQEVCVMVARMTRPLIGDKPIELREIYPSSRVIVEADEDRLQQVLFNLVSNAIKFTQHGYVAIKLEIIDIDARLSIEDTGLGISEEEQKKIFSRFYQVDSAESRQAGGTGLGLSISQKLLELHDSEIILRSTVGEGSLFYFDLPLKQALPHRPETDTVSKTQSVSRHDERTYSNLLAGNTSSVDRRQSRPEDVNDMRTPTIAPASDRPARVMVVDDEYLNLRIVESHLSDIYELVTAASGAEALEKIEDAQPDILITDLMMPVMTGFQLCQILRKRYDMNELPIIILTAKNRVEDLVKGLSVGANDYITKPFSKEELRVRVAKQIELLQLQRMREENQRLNWQLQRYERSEKHLREREQRMAQMLDITGDPLLCVDETGELVYINQAAGELFAVQPQDHVDHSVNELSEKIRPRSAELADALRFPFNEDMISTQDDTRYLDYTLPGCEEAPDGCRGRFSIIAVTMDQEFYMLVFERRRSGDEAPEQQYGDDDNVSLPRLIQELNRNMERTQLLSEKLAQIGPEDLKKHAGLVSDLKEVDRVIQSMSSTVPNQNDEIEYREALVKLMQDCHHYWQKVTGESVIELAEKSRIWSVSVDNGRLRTRSMNRYLSVDKLPDNPRWRQVARTAYFVLSKVSHDKEARDALEASVANLQDIVERRALN